jgi:hypothetical protein
LDFILDGIIDLQVERTSWPTITFIDDLDRNILTIQIDVAASNLIIVNAFEVRRFFTANIKKLKRNWSKK